MRASLSVRVESERIEAVRADLAVATVALAERPLRGDAARIDWRLLGDLSRLLRRGQLSGADGEVALLPSFGRLRAQRVLLLGVGERKALGATRLAAKSREAVLCAIRLGCESLALAPPAASRSLGSARATAALLEGALAALAEQPARVRLCLLVPGIAPDVWQELERAAERAGIAVRIALGESETLEDASRPGGAARGSRRAAV